MEREVISGKVICFTLSDRKISVNLKTNSGQFVGLVVKTIKRPLLSVFPFITDNEKVVLILQNGKIFSIQLGSGKNPWILNMEENLDIKANLKSCACEQIDCRYIYGFILAKTAPVSLQIMVSGTDKVEYEIYSNTLQAQAVFNEFLTVSKRKDELLLFQNEKGKVTKVINKTRDREFIF